MHTFRILCFIYTLLIFNTLSAQTTILIDGQAAGDTLFVCAGESYSFEAQSPVGTTIEWSPAEIVSPDASSSMISVTVDMSTELVLTATPLVGGTPTSDTLFLQINNSEPAVSFPNPPIICVGNAINLNTNDQQDRFTFAWEGDDGFTSDQSNPQVMPAQSTTYSVTVTGCNSSIERSVTIEVVEPPEVTITADEQTVCAGERLELSSTTTLPTPDFFWVFPNGDTIPGRGTVIDNPQMSGTYTVTYTYNSAVCDIEPQTASLFVQVNDNFDFELLTSVDDEETDAIDSTELILGCEIALTVASANPELTYEWTIKDEVDESITGNIYREELTEEGAFTYGVVATSTDGCTQRGEASITVRAPRLPTEEMLIPNAFTPNGDNTNDFFAPLLEKDVTIQDLKIYNRWGQCVYNNENGDQGWDGTFEEADAPADVYIYVITISLPDGNEPATYSARGEVTLLR